MKRYELWADGKLINDYTRKGDALNAWCRLLYKYQRIYVCDVQDDYKHIVVVNKNIYKNPTKYMNIEDYKKAINRASYNGDEYTAERLTNELYHILQSEK